jgi:thiol-disulfide isomerase/thioredoxin
VTTRRLWLLGGCAVLLVAAVAAWAAADDEQKGLVGAVDPRPAPPISGDDVRRAGTAVTLPAGRPAIVNFLASWCGPCRKELPELERVSGTVAVVGVDVKDNRDKAVALLDETGATFPVAYDPKEEVAGRYRLTGMPTTVFVDARGQVVGRVHGPVTGGTLRAWAEHLSAAG